MTVAAVTQNTPLKVDDSASFKTGSTADSAVDDDSYAFTSRNHDSSSELSDCRDSLLNEILMGDDGPHLEHREDDLDDSDLSSFLPVSLQNSSRRFHFDYDECDYDDDDDESAFAFSSGASQDEDSSEEFTLPHHNHGSPPSPQNSVKSSNSHAQHTRRSKLRPSPPAMKSPIPENASVSLHKFMALQQATNSPPIDARSLSGQSRRSTKSAPASPVKMDSPRRRSKTIRVSPEQLPQMLQSSPERVVGLVELMKMQEHLQTEKIQDGTVPLKKSKKKKKKSDKKKSKSKSSGSERKSPGRSRSADPKLPLPGVQESETSLTVTAKGESQAPQPTATPPRKPTRTKSTDELQGPPHVKERLAAAGASAISRLGRRKPDRAKSADELTPYKPPAALGSILTLCTKTAKKAMRQNSNDSQLGLLSLSSSQRSIDTNASASTTATSKKKNKRPDFTRARSASSLGSDRNDGEGKAKGGRGVARNGSQESVRSARPTLMRSANSKASTSDDDDASNRTPQRVLRRGATNSYGSNRSLNILPERVRNAEPPIPLHTRAVLNSNHPLAGELVILRDYNPDLDTFQIQLLGDEALHRHTQALAARARAAKQEFYADKVTPVLWALSGYLKAAPPNALWAYLPIRGAKEKKQRVPVTVQRYIHNDRQLGLKIQLDAFPGLQQVVPIARGVLGVMFCNDWSNLDHVKTALKASPACIVKTKVLPPSVFEKAPLGKHDFVVDAKKQPALLKALEDYRLIRRTSRTMQTSKEERYPVYKVLFKQPKIAEEC